MGKVIVEQVISADDFEASDDGDIDYFGAATFFVVLPPAPHSGGR